MTSTNDILFVAWQDAKDHRYWPVARLVKHQEAEAVYEFAYIQGARDAQKKGFQPFMAFPNLESVYHSDVLFPFFSNRLLSESRPDRAIYIQRLGLDPAHPDEFAILARSGGGRATDPIELFPFPSSVDGVGYTTYFCVHGLRHLSPSCQQKALELHPGDRLYLLHDCQNPVDPAAMLLRTNDCVIVGFLPGYLLEDARRLADGCGTIEFEVAQVNPPPAPLSQRLLCKMSACWPDESFVPFSSAAYQPIAPNASQVTRGVVEAGR
jgi:hypothetical protein